MHTQSDREEGYLPQAQVHFYQSAKAQNIFAFICIYFLKPFF